MSNSIGFDCSCHNLKQNTTQKSDKIYIKSIQQLLTYSNNYLPADHATECKIIPFTLDDRSVCRQHCELQTRHVISHVISNNRSLCKRGIPSSHARKSKHHLYDQNVHLIPLKTHLNNNYSYLRLQYDCLVAQELL